MKKTFGLLFLLMVVPVMANAQDVDLVSEIVPNVSAEEKLQTQTEFETQEDDETIADVDDRGIFSFLNFSFIKKTFSSDDQEDDTTQSADSTKPKIVETPLQRKIRKANEGNVNTQLSLGYMYLYGENGVEANYEEAFKYYEMAAKQNNPIALNNLGSLYFNGIGTKRDYRKAVQLFAKAAQNGSDDAAVNLAFIYLSGKNSAEFQKKAIELFMQAAQAGNNTAKFMLGYAYYRGFQVEQNYHKAVELIRAASDAKFDEAQHIMAMMYLNGQGIAQNYGNAVKYLKVATSQGNLDATMQLGDILAAGTIYPKDLLFAHTLFNIAAIDNVPYAAQKRDFVTKSLKIDELLEAQTEAEKFKAQPSELTSYIRQTFGYNIRRYIDENMASR